MPKLGFGERKTVAPKDLPGLVALLAELMSAAINNEVDLENARVALNAATRMVDAIQADTRMKAIAMAANRTVSAAANEWPSITMERPTEAPTLPQ